MKKFSVIGILGFLGTFIYFYKTIGKFRQSIIAAWAALTIFVSGPKTAEAKDAHAWVNQNQQQQGRVQRNRGLFGSTSDKAIPGPEI